MLYRLPAEKELTDRKLAEFIEKHAAECAFRYEELGRAYETDFPIFHEPKKPKYKPDNRIAVNFAKYIVDTMNGFFIGNPIKLNVDDGNETIKRYVELLDQYNDQDDNNAELSKICSIYGHGYEMYYVDEIGNIGITYLDPREAFMNGILFDCMWIQRTSCMGVFLIIPVFAGLHRKERLYGKKEIRSMDLTVFLLLSMWKIRSEWEFSNRFSR